MKYFYNPKTKKKMTEAEWSKLDDKEKSCYREWEERGNKRGGRTRDNKRSGRSSGERDKPRETLQDYQWWNADDKISKAVANIPFNRFPGMKEDLGVGTTADGVALSNKSDNVTPGVMVIDYIPTYGRAETSLDAINITMRSVYTWVRHQNSGKTNYDAPDLMMYLMAMDQAYLAYYEAVRVYDTAMTYVKENRNIPTVLANALGFKLTDVTQNLANYRYQLNVLAAKLSSMCVPNKFDIFKRHALLAKVVFTDSDSLRSQMYVFKAKQYMKFSPRTSEKGGELVGVTSPMYRPGSTPATASEIIANLQALIEAILSDEDMNIMSGDILKAYGRENLFSLDFVDESSTIALSMNEEVLQQIENSVSLSTDASTNKLSKVFYGIHQTNNILVGSLVVNSNPYLPTYTQDLYYFNSHKSDPTYEDVMEFSRCSCYSTGNDVYYGTELILHYEIVYMNNADSTPTPITTIFTSYSAGIATSYSGACMVIALFTKLIKFDWHPIFYAFTYGSSTSVQDYWGTVGDLKVYTLLHAEDMAALHDAAVLGCLGKLTMSAV